MEDREKDKKFQEHLSNWEEKYLMESKYEPILSKWYGKDLKWP